MRELGLIVFGPADGFKAYRFPDFHEVQDDTYALASSEILLEKGGAAFLIKRANYGGSASAVRIGVYRQVYEPNLDRAGHSFGAILEFPNRIPELNGVVEVLSGLATLIEEGCVKNGKFCDLTQFQSFLQNKLSSLSVRAIAHLTESKSQALAFMPLPNDESVVYSFKLNGDLFGDSVLEILSWFLYRPGGMISKGVAAYQAALASPGALTRPLPSLESLDRHAVDHLINQTVEAQNALSKIRRELEGAQKQYAQLASYSSELEGKNKELSGTISSLNTQISELRNQPRTTLAEGDFNRIRGIFREVAWPAAPAPTRVTYTEPDKIPTWGILRWAIIAACVLVPTVAGYFLYTRRFWLFSFPSG